MYGIVLMAALAGSGESAGFGHGGDFFFHGYGFGLPYGGTYAHGYGYARPIARNPGGIVLPPNWHAPDPGVSEAEAGLWFEYIAALEGDERHEMMAVWCKADCHARQVLVGKLVALKVRLASEKAKLEMERAMEKYKEEMRPLEEEEQAKWQRYLRTLKGKKREDAEKEWKEADNRGKRRILKDIPDSDE